MLEDNTHIIAGPPPLKPIPNVSLGKLIFDNLLLNVNNGEALVDALDGDSISYQTLIAKTCSLADSLRKLGCGKDTIIGICSENCKEFFIPVIATLYIGGIIAPVNHNYTKSEISHALNISKPSIIFCSQTVSSKFLELKEKLTYIQKIIIINQSSSCPKDDFMDNYMDTSFYKTSALASFKITETQPCDQIGYILCSSGTTGLPKGVMLTHKNVITCFMHANDPRYLNQNPGHSTLGILPFFHSFGMFRNLNCILKGIKVVVIKKFEERLFLSSIEKYKITVLSLVPPLVVFLTKSPLVDEYNLSSVTELSCGAAPLSKNTEELLKNRLKIKTFRQGYGMTETTLSVMSMPYGHKKTGSSGKLHPYMLCKIRDPETGKALGHHQVGEVCVKGPLVMKGYYNNEEATKNTFTTDGWLLTGDLGYYDEGEYFYIVDRLKELIKYKGFQVPPAELEAILLSNPKIKDAAVVGLPDEDAGELPLAFVAVNSNVTLTEKEVQQFVADKVSPQKRLRGGVIFVNEIPKNPSGKILRRKLREMLKKFKSKL